MAVYKITEKQYLDYNKFEYGSKKKKLIFNLSIFVIIISTSFYFGQYLFSMFLVFVFFLILFLIKIKLSEELRYKNNPFLNHEIELELSDDFYNIQVKQNSLKLSVDEIA